MSFGAEIGPAYQFVFFNSQFYKTVGEVWRSEPQPSEVLLFYDKPTWSPDAVIYDVLKLCVISLKLS